MMGNLPPKQLILTTKISKVFLSQMETDLTSLFQTVHYFVAVLVGSDILHFIPFVWFY